MQRLACLCSQMPSRFTGKLCQFLFQHLERGTFGERLRWLDRPSGVFQLVWKHGNGSSTVPHRDCAVFLVRKPILPLYAIQCISRAFAAHALYSVLFVCTRECGAT
ncbi:hypothetical protein HPB49_013883 [Dermacentor silvarum]|uniref:Uncharacterized protein n=1 Tax=Dermacentor silvarum TaxID=543639 RepID=A0ACB8DDD2_DERSI|nr:hypothetical protein HPB49_013883 [Dermacentor silvarum]